MLCHLSSDHREFHLVTYCYSGRVGWVYPLALTTENQGDRMRRTIVGTVAAAFAGIALTVAAPAQATTTTACQHGTLDGEGVLVATSCTTPTGTGAPYELRVVFLWVTGATPPQMDKVVVTCETATVGPYSGGALGFLPGSRIDATKCSIG
jgi:hypothetical protein